jgi:hypothetical protein
VCPADEPPEDDGAPRDTGHGPGCPRKVAQVRALRAPADGASRSSPVVAERLGLDGPEGLAKAGANRLIGELQAPAELPA